MAIKQDDNVTSTTGGNMAPRNTTERQDWTGLPDKNDKILFRLGLCCFSNGEVRTSKYSNCLFWDCTQRLVRTLGQFVGWIGFRRVVGSSHYHKLFDDRYYGMTMS